MGKSTGVTSEKQHHPNILTSLIDDLPVAGVAGVSGGTWGTPEVKTPVLAPH